MGLLDSLTGSSSPDNSSPLIAGILQMIQNQPGGLQGLVQSFQDKGLGGLVSSWVSTGQNLPASGDQIHQALGSDRVKELAAAVGMSPDMASSTIAQLLPGIVDKLTPDGQVPEHSNVMDIASSLLKSFTQAKAS